MNEKTTFAAGCFWHVEDSFCKINGIVSTTVGYTGGHMRNPSYEDVCTDTTKHAEAVLVEYDPAKISYKQLLETFWDLHDPTTRNRQGPDVGTQYRSAIFYHNKEQREEALASKERQQESGRYGGREIVTEIVPAAEFYRAEEYHQKYFRKRGRFACRVCAP
ncbi:MAG TPA: peptide-methionine (S)-S-oxide reductase MsrA [Thermoplasmata archaeon]